jgi:double-stranded uracil-DNA glycosylase
MNAKATSFAPIIDDSARTLILGSMPGAKSLRAHEYYANPRNTFWRIMGCVFGFSENATYIEKIAALKVKKIALWDVMRSCERSGSLDTNIKQGTIEPNDFVSLFQDYTNIVMILFNGVKAETEYKKQVLPKLSVEAQEIKLLRLPSTSPAMASIPFDKKLGLWSKAINGA